MELPPDYVLLAGVALDDVPRRAVHAPQVRITAPCRWFTPLLVARDFFSQLRIWLTECEGTPMSFIASGGVAS
jgi:hypothetical protein